jgi:hypothetical protein
LVIAFVLLAELEFVQLELVFVVVANLSELILHQ